ncbi:MAG TPA: hypothetical protein VIY29_31080, partial [Ktedonobacteraceae bacterium]
MGCPPGLDPDSPCCQKVDVGRCQVINLSPRRQREEDEQQCVGPYEGPPQGTARSPQESDPHDPQPRKREGHHEQLADHPRADVAEPPVLLVQGLRHGDRRPAVRGLPPQVGDGEQGGNDCTGQCPAVEDQPPSPAEEHTEEDRHGKEADAVLVGQPDPEDHAAQQPV